MVPLAMHLRRCNMGASTDRAASKARSVWSTPRTRRPMSHPAAPSRLTIGSRRDAGGMGMRVFVAGGTGVMGRRLVPELVLRGH